MIFSNTLPKRIASSLIKRIWNLDDCCRVFKSTYLKKNNKKDLGKVLYDARQ